MACDVRSDMAAFPFPTLASCRPINLCCRRRFAPYLGRYRGQTRLHTRFRPADLYALARRAGPAPLAAARTDIERYVRCMQDSRRFQPSTVSRRLWIVVRFYRVCVIDGHR